MELASGVMTIPGEPDFLTTDLRLAAINRTITAYFGTDLSGLRIADLGCLEGGFSAAFAKRGAEVVGLEAREINLAKARLLRRQMQLDNMALVQLDVKDFVVERFGVFDIVLALGIAYHLDRPAAWLRQIAATVGAMLIVDSHTAPELDSEVALLRPDLRGLSRIETEYVGEQAYRGRWFFEFDEAISDVGRQDQVWASWSNHRSLWLTEESLVRALNHSGFDVVMQQHDATIDRHEFNRTEFSRGMYIALRSKLTSVG